MIYPSIDELDAKVGSKYALVIAVAKRARQLREGAQPLVESTSKNPITIALEEIAAGKIRIHKPTPEEQAAREEQLALPRERKREIEEAVDLLRAPVQEVTEKTGDEETSHEEEGEEELTASGNGLSNVNDQGSSAEIGLEEETEIVEE